MTQNIKKVMKIRDTFHKKFKTARRLILAKTIVAELWDQYKNHRKKVKKLISLQNRPQGSTLSALLFILYLNFFSSCNYIINIITSINKDIASWCNWSADHGLNINSRKGQAIII